MTDLTLTIEGKDWKAKTKLPRQSRTPEQIAYIATRLYYEASPDPIHNEPMVELDSSLYCQRNGQLDLYVSRVRFAKPPTRNGKPRWGRWHDLTVERERAQISPESDAGC